MNVRAKRYTGDKAVDLVETVSDEEDISVWLNGREVACFQASPRDLGELGCGFIAAEGLIAFDGIEDIRVEDNNIHVQAQKAPPSQKPSVVDSNQAFRSEMILSSLNYLEKASSEWGKTGGTHAAVLVSAGGQMICSFEDVSRRNALDKVIGWSWLNKKPMHDKFMLFTGRLSGEIVRRAARVQVPLIASNTAPLSQAVCSAEKLRVALIGFARENRFTVYSGFERIV